MCNPTSAQNSRQAHRDGKGKYIKNPCDLCGKGAPLENYFSDDRCNKTGFGITLHSRCADKLAKLDDATYEALAAFVSNLNGEW